MPGNGVAAALTPPRCKRPYGGSSLPLSWAWVIYRGLLSGAPASAIVPGRLEVTEESIEMATTKAKAKAPQGGSTVPSKASRPSDKNGAGRAAKHENGARGDIGTSPADLPLPDGYVPKVELPPGYRPRGDEEYMSSEHLEYFRRKLVIWRQELIEESQQTIENLRDEVRDVGDEAERATRETENSLELRTRDRYRKLIGKIDKALKRIEDGRYGYCEETDEEIGIERLEARPIATLCLDAQERWEHRQRQMGD